MSENVTVESYTLPNYAFVFNAVSSTRSDIHFPNMDNHTNNIHSHISANEVKVHTPLSRVDVSLDIIPATESE